jgi:hypothetical protein
LWLSSGLGASVIHTDETGTVLQSFSQVPITGIAFDGVNLYFEDSLGTITKRTSDRATILNSFSAPTAGQIAEDMARDSKRQRLYRITRNSVLARMDPATGRLE